MSSFIGPVIPPGAAVEQKEEENAEVVEDSEPSESQVEVEEEEDQQDDDGSLYGPALPPGLTGDAEESGSDEEGCVVGPMPQQMEESREDYEKRLELLRMKKLLASIPKKREEWMTELPPQLKSFGLGARTFKYFYFYLQVLSYLSFTFTSRKPVETGEGEDKSGWTDTPLEKMIKSAAGDLQLDDSKEKPKKKRPHHDEEMEKLTKKLNANRGDSLLAVHQRDKQSSADTTGMKRIPFNRDKDLSVSGLDAKDKSKVIESAKELAGRFKHGAGKYDP